MHSAGVQYTREKKKNIQKKRNRGRDTANATSQNGGPKKGTANPPAGERGRASLKRRRGKEAENNSGQSGGGKTESRRRISRRRKREEKRKRERRRKGEGTEKGKKGKEGGNEKRKDRRGRGEE